MKNILRPIRGSRASWTDSWQMRKRMAMWTTLYGRRRPVPELKSTNFMQRSFGERVAMNAPIQGTAADIIKIAMIRVSERLKKEQLKSRLILQVHDELLIEAEESELEQVKTILGRRCREPQSFLSGWRLICIQERTGTKPSRRGYR